MSDWYTGLSKMLGEASSDQRSSCILFDRADVCLLHDFCVSIKVPKDILIIDSQVLWSLLSICLLFNCLLSNCQTVSKPLSFPTRATSAPSHLSKKCLLLQLRPLPQGLIAHSSLLLHSQRLSIPKAQYRLSAWALQWTPSRRDLNL